MKKTNKHPTAPNGLTTYLANNPNGTWDAFTKKKNRRIEMQLQIVSDQRGLCAYCEIDTQISNVAGENDFRIDHFVPKDPSQSSVGSHNYGLDWFNLRGCCHGGSQTLLAAPNRKTSPDHSCDVPKNNNNWVGVILDPLHDVPAFPIIFQYTELGNDAGKISIDESICPSELQDKARATISKLRLDAPRLNRLRSSVIDKLREEIIVLLDDGKSLEEATDALAQLYLTPKPTGYWEAFFTCIRWYLGSSAERHLQSINYQG